MTGLDTNIFVYSCDQTDPRKQKIALDLIRSTTDCVMLWQVACEFVAVSRKLAKQGFTAHDAWNRLSELLGFFPLSLPTRAVLKEAQRLHLGKQMSYWDALLMAACHESGVTRLYSEDVPGGQPPDGLEIINPFG